MQSTTPPIATISLYKGAKDNSGAPISPASALNRILTDNKLRIAIDALRTIQDKKRRAEKKQKLDAVTWSGSFTERKADKITWHSGIICIDIDDLQPEVLSALRQQITESDPYVFAHFISPSGNGLKLLFQTALMGEVKGAKEVKAIKEKHNNYFRAIANYLLHTYNLVADESGKDVSRLCFLTYDSTLDVHGECTTVTAEILQIPPFQFDDKPTVKPAKTLRKINLPFDPENGTEIDFQHEADMQGFGNSFNLLDDQRAFTNKIYTYENAANGNKHINTFVYNCKRAGVDIDELASYCLSSFHDYEADKPGEIMNIVNSVYNNAEIPFGIKKPFIKTDRPAPLKKQLAKQERSLDTPDDYGAGEEGFNTDDLFWYEIEKVDEKTKKVSREYKYSYDGGIKFLTNNGFWKLPMDNGNYQFIKVDDNIVDIKQERHMREYMLSLLETRDAEFRGVREMFRRGSKMYSATSYMEGLRYHKPDFKRDTKHTAYIYFRNCYVEVTKGDMVCKAYKDMQGSIWRKQVIQADFTIDNSNDDCKFKHFLECAILGRERVKGDKLTELEAAKLLGTYTSIGYLLHRYKNPANTRAVIAVDKEIRRGDENNGRSGKSLLGKALGVMAPRCLLDGRNFKWDGRNPFDKLNLDHALLHFDDIAKHFDFERLYSLITEDFTYNKMYMDSITIPFEDSPKIYITTNTSIRASGESAKARMHVVEFTNYFNAENTPHKKYGHMFFSDWDAKEMNLFYNFMLDCLQLYLEEGLQPFPLENYDENKLIDDIGLDEIEWIEEKMGKQGEKVPKQELFKDFIFEFPNKNKMKQNTFTKWLKMIAKVRGYVFNADALTNGKATPGERMYTNGKDYVSFTGKKVELSEEEKENNKDAF